MRVTIHQPEHLPWIGYFHKMSLADVYVFLDNVQYRKNYFQNRNRILTSQGPSWLTVPVYQRGHTESTLQEVRIDNTSAWRRKYWQTLHYAYKKHPYYEQYAGFFADLLAKEWDSLVSLNCEVILYLAATLNIHPQFVWASSLNVQGKSSELLLAICEALGAKQYISGPSGRNYLDANRFSQNGIDVVYHDFTHPQYQQYGHSDFISHLSIVDLLFNLGEKAIDIIQSC